MSDRQPDRQLSRRRKKDHSDEQRADCLRCMRSPGSARRALDRNGISGRLRQRRSDELGQWRPALSTISQPIVYCARRGSKVSDDPQSRPGHGAVRTMHIRRDGQSATSIPHLQQYIVQLSNVCKSWHSGRQRYRLDDGPWHWLRSHSHVPVFPLVFLLSAWPSPSPPHPANSPIPPN